MTAEEFKVGSLFNSFNEFEAKSLELVWFVKINLSTRLGFTAIYEENCNHN